ncbi:hypothetical protein PGT21_022713 [Puccinia graminis f. sp. tritici]|uniref:Uncharacterized protein n=1 Tax=Puccinia graminis f. sp. tritici TaxID=56615 RepID=A0A5B0MCP0_PUCGR|nr:hypothetical protein PGT21_022713 [Puccinia graminis f. sp. tritici]
MPRAADHPVECELHLMAGTYSIWCRSMVIGWSTPVIGWSSAVIGWSTPVIGWSTPVIARSTHSNRWLVKDWSTGCPPSDNRQDQSSGGVYTPTDDCFLLVIAGFALICLLCIAAWTAVSGHLQMQSETGCVQPITDSPGSSPYGYGLAWLAAQQVGSGGRRPSLRSPQ